MTSIHEMSAREISDTYSQKSAGVATVGKSHLIPRVWSPEILASYLLGVHHRLARIEEALLRFDLDGQRDA